jgi:hypothetical protein
MAINLKAAKKSKKCRKVINQPGENNRSENGSESQ